MSIALDGTIFMAAYTKIQVFAPGHNMRIIDPLPPSALAVRGSQALSLATGVTTYYKLSRSGAEVYRCPTDRPELAGWGECRLVPGGIACKSRTLVPTTHWRIWDPLQDTYLEITESGQNTLEVDGIHDGWVFVRDWSGVSVPAWDGPVYMVRLVHVASGCRVDLALPGLAYYFSPAGILLRLGRRMRLWDPTNNRHWDFAPWGESAAWDVSKQNTRFRLTEAPTAGTTRVWIINYEDGIPRVRFFDTAQEPTIPAPWAHQCNLREDLDIRKGRDEIQKGIGRCRDLMFSNDVLVEAVLMEGLAVAAPDERRAEFVRAVSTRRDQDPIACLLSRNIEGAFGIRLVTAAVLTGTEEGLALIDEIEQEDSWRARSRQNRAWLREARELIRMYPTFCGILQGIGAKAAKKVTDRAPAEKFYRAVPYEPARKIMPR